MTIEKLLECSADELEKMTDAEVEAFFAPMFDVVRPSTTVKPSSSPKIPSSGSKMKPAMSEEKLKRLRDLEAKVGFKLT